MWPIIIALKAHVHCLQASISLRRINLTGASKVDKVKQKMTVNDRLQINIQALAAMLMMSWEMTREQAQTWGVKLYFTHRKVKLPNLTEIDKETFENISPEELQALGVARTILEEATVRPKNKEPEDYKTHSDKGCKGCRYDKIRAIYKNREELDSIIMPEVERYEKRSISTEEAGVINRQEAERRAKDADEAISHPAQETMGKITNLRQLNPQDLEQFIDYSKSQAALNNFFSGQTGLQVEKMIPQAEFVKTLKRIELVDFKGDREVMIKHWITHPEIRTNFNKFFNMFKNRVFQDISKRYSVPDHPPRHYFENKDDCPTPLHNLETGLVQPDYLAYLCSQVIEDDSEMLKPQYNLYT